MGRMLGSTCCDNVKSPSHCYYDEYFTSVFECILQMRRTALHHASESGHLPVVVALLDAGANMRILNVVSW